MKALLFILSFVFSFLLFAQREPTNEEILPDGQDDYYAEEQEELLNENDELRAENERLQGECNCNREQEEYVTQREETPMVIINQLPPPEQQVQQEVAPPAPSQFNNGQFQNNDQFILPGPDTPPPGLMPIAPQGQN